MKTLVLIENPAITAMRKSVCKIASASSVKVQLDIAAILDDCLTVDISALNVPDLKQIVGGANGINACVFAHELKELDVVSSNVAMKLEDDIKKINVGIFLQGSETREVFVHQGGASNEKFNAHRRLFVACARAGLSLEQTREVLSLLQSVSANEDTLACLVFHYGLRVDEADLIISEQNYL